MAKSCSVRQADHKPTVSAFDRCDSLVNIVTISYYDVHPSCNTPDCVAGVTRCKSAHQPIRGSEGAGPQSAPQ
ncbi:hypothetical protein RRG08_043062 [Elysia crispata]|uniref:Uncharacterized protein n=1 Tax=Elysia crispata TaxID=231223 RepID=A0AAE0XZI7_9GAST|nr:hypothetical protein RRG08_043062 [Elysia crispata]